MHEGSASSAPGAPRRSAYLWPVLAAVVAVAGLAAARSARLKAADPAPALWVDPASARLTCVPEWADPRWLESLALVLARQPCFALDEAGPLEPLARELEALSFVERVERCEAGPAGLVLELSLRKPVACIPVRGEFALVDEDGVVLAGRWPLPPRLGRAFLPVLGPLDDELFDAARAGDWLSEPEHTDAIDVALSLAEHLAPEQRAALGRVVIDARMARRASVSEPGVRLELEGGRVALFGRAPGCGEPGELGAGAKWAALLDALALFAADPERHDWELVDLRWDRPDLALRHAPRLAALEPQAERAPSEPRVRRERDPSRAFVR